MAPGVNLPGPLKRRADKIIVFGDLHGNWNESDLRLLEESDFDLALFCGDLGSGTLKNELSIIRSISNVRIPGLILPGNNDAQFLAELGAELAHQSGATDLRRLAGQEAASFLEPCGYTSHVLDANGGSLTLVTGRPLAMGGCELSFPAQLERNFGVSSMADSVARLVQLIDEAPTDAIGFLAHNGPFGLGGEPSDPWSRDFPLEGADGVAPLDWGDEDLSQAIWHAKQNGKEVLFVIAGHMHRTAETPRRLCVLKDETAYVNAAVSPRIVADSEGERHHFIALSVFPNEAEAENRVRVVEQFATF